MPNYVANTRISGPSNVNIPADVDFNGLQWSYRYGLIFPTVGAAQSIPWIMPDVAAATYVPRTS